MKNIILLLLLSVIGVAGEKPTVTIAVYAPLTDDSVNVYIAGNNARMGNWRPDQAKLDFAGDHLWRKIFRFETGAVIEYKITRGSWANEASDESGRPFQNFVLQVNGDTTIVDTVLYWKEGREAPIVGGITGEVRYHRGIEAGGLLPRDVIVWLPPGYDDEPNCRYPVLYMQDGQNLFDPHTAAFKVDWRIDETADSLIQTGEIAPIIIVGIANTARRSQEYTPTPLGARYRNFVIHTIKPLIDENYRTLKDAQHTAIGGSSAGGIVSFMLAWEHPEIFSKAICMSPAFKIQDIDYVKNVRDYRGEKKDIAVYIDNGGIGLEERLQPGIDEMLNALEEKGFVRGIDYFWRKDENARHFEAAWGRRMPEALRLLFGQDD